MIPMIFGVSKTVLTRAGQNTVLGISIVFMMLLLISFIISMFKFINKAANRSVKAVEKSAPTVVAPVVDEQDDLELVAVITAAIYAFEQEQGNDVDPGALVVRSIKKSNKSKWQNA